MARSMPGESGDWIRAMHVETAHIENPRERTAWLAGALRVALRLRARSLATDDGMRPASVTLAVAYLAVFSAYLFLHTVLQIISPGVHEPWTIAWFPVTGCLLLTLLPAALAAGLWACDELARVMTIAFAVLDLVVVLTFVHAAGFDAVRVFKICGDLLILAALNHPSVRRAFEWRPRRGTDAPVLGLLN